MWKVCWSKGRLYWKIANLFHFCHLSKLVRLETYGPYHVCTDFVILSWVTGILQSPTNSYNCSKDPNMSKQFTAGYKKKHIILTNPEKLYRGCPRRSVPDFGRVFLMLKYTNITQNTYIQSWTVTEIMAREVWNFDSCYTLIDYQLHIITGRNMLFL